MSRNARIALVAAAIAVAVAAFVIARPGDDDSDDKTTAATTTTAQTTTGQATTPAPPPKPQIPSVQVKDGKPVGGVKRIEVDKGDRIRLRVTSDAAHEVHMHGFDVLKDVAPGKPAVFNVEASFPGRFEVELEDTGQKIADVEVQP
jgi:heme/copper-type cytochrome/quinol oxidase subunit 2